MSGSATPMGFVTGWSNTQIVASVATNAISGIVKVEQNGIWSNAMTFTVPGTFGGGGGGNGTSVTLVPNVINMVVGGTQSIAALNSSSQSVTGLTWSSSNTAVATLSTRSTYHHSRWAGKYHYHSRKRVRRCHCLGWYCITNGHGHLVEPRKRLRCH
jgi:hypothetical protein